MSITITNPIKKATMDETNQIKKLGEAADKALIQIENGQRNQIRKEQTKYEKQLYNRLLKKYSAGTLSWNESHMLAELKKQDDVTDEGLHMNENDQIESLQQKIVEELNYLSKRLREFGINIAPLQEFSMENVLTTLNQMRQAVKEKIEQQNEYTQEENTKDEEDKVEKSDTPIVQLQLEEDIPGIGDRGHTLNIYKDGWQLA